MQFDKTLFTEKRNFKTGERELFLSIENSVEERVEVLEKMLQYKRVIQKSNSEK
ncbi:MAG: hypothetical protein HOG95_05895 [Rhodospirillaceae bacterium]|nr:hypothetical protein [Rhodospirillaceae bacterium]MBT5939442.1 hypothetical protein [Rhodospirillaceae bacterium]MBT7267465.1 hypothetical protein [Rhodospirillaceae bacterium]